jgi:hypothetical protein
VSKFVYVGGAVINVDAIACVTQTQARNPSTTIHLIGGQMVDITLTPLEVVQFFLDPKNHLRLQET